MTFHLREATVPEMQEAMASGEVTCRRLVQLYLDRIDAYDRRGPSLTAVQTVNPMALEEADRLDAERRAGRLRGPLHGIPVLVKDQLETGDMPTTYGSALFMSFVPRRDATVVQRLRAAGAVILAKNTMSEYAVPGFHGSAYGFCRNPYDPSRIPGGSSCGTGAAVAASFGAVGVGEDTGGSIRNPASFNCLVGMRPTVGLISRFGILPGTPSRDTLGPMARTVRDAAILLNAMAGYDANDPATANCVGHVPGSYTSFLNENGLRGKRLGVVRQPFAANTDTRAADYHDIWSVMERALRDLAAQGAEIIDPVPVDRLIELLRVPMGVGESEPAIDRYLAQHPNAPARTLREIVISAEGMVLPSQRAQLAEKLGRGTGDLAYLQGQVNRDEVRLETLRLMADLQLDALLYPTANHSPSVIPPDILTSSETRSTSGSNGALSSATAYPTITVPAGFTSEGLPVGLSFFSRPFTESLLVELAYAYEQATHYREPPKTTPPLPSEP